MNQDFLAWAGQGRITDRTLEHLGQSDRGILMIRKRFFEELTRSGDKEKAAVEAAAGLLMPGGISILTDAMGLLVLLVAPMPILTKLAVAGSFWVLSNFASVLILDPILCCYFPTPRRRPEGGEGNWLDRPLRRLGAFCVSPAAPSPAISLWTPPSARSSPTSSTGCSPSGR